MMRKIIASAFLALALITMPGIGATPAPAATAPLYLVTNNGILQWTYYWDPYARAWVLIRVELYFPD